MQQKLFNLPVTKKCTICKIEKLATKQFFIWRNDRNIFENRCKLCAKKYREEHKKEAKAYAKKYNVENREKLKTKSKKWRIENPEKYKTGTKKHYEEHKEERLAQAKKYRAERKEWYKAYQKKWREERLEECKARSKKYQSEHEEELKIYQKKYRGEHREKHKAYTKKHYQENKEEHIAKVKKWRKANPEKIKKIRIEHQKRKLGKYASLFDLTDAEMNIARTDWSAQIKNNKRCAICDLPAEHAHHIIYSSNYPSLSLNPNNGIALCIDHHAEAHLFDRCYNLLKASKTRK